MKGARNIIMMAVFVLIGCGPTDIHIDWSQRPTSFRVRLESNPSSQDKPLALTSNVTLTVDIQALSAGPGKAVMKGFSKWVHLYVRPGYLQVISPKGAYNPPRSLEKGGYVYVKNGEISGVKVKITKAFGKTRIWAEDNGFVPPTVSGTTAECADGKDNNGNGLIDMADPGCLMAMDHSEEPGTGAAGVTGTIWFNTPKISDVQGHADASPYPHEEVNITRGFMVVTRVTNSGFYVTDVTDKTGYNSIYVYSYHMPAFLRACDHITDLRGTVGEFYGFTELNFPSWQFQPWEEKSNVPCYVPDPTVLTPAMVKNHDAMESLESGLVRIMDVTTGDPPTSCDFNNDGKVNYCSSNSKDKECQCSTSCTYDPYCTQRLNYLQYGQWAAVIHDTKGGNPTKIWVISQQTVPQFDPFKDGGRRHIVSITGTLKEFKYLKPYPWIIEVRCPDDLVVTGNPKKANESCIYPRTGAIDAPN